jgi:serine/threonine protein kinase
MIRQSRQHGGGYNSELRVTIPDRRRWFFGMKYDKKIFDINLTTTSQYDRDEIMFRVRKNDDSTETHYKNVSVVGQGTYGKLYLVQRVGDNERFVIKLAKRQNEREIDQTITKEARYLDQIMRGVPDKCKYVAISQGVTKGIEHAVFPYMGSKNLSFIETDRFSGIYTNSKMIPGIISDVIGCLHALNSAGISHLDIKLDNIVLDEATGISHIIDYGLSVMHSNIVSTESLADEYIVLVGDYQSSVEIIMSQIFKFSMGGNHSPAVKHHFDRMFLSSGDKIKQTADNFGLFWLIIGLLTFGKDQLIFNMMFGLRLVRSINYNESNDSYYKRVSESLCRYFAFFYSLSVTQSSSSDTYMQLLYANDFCGVKSKGGSNIDAIRKEFIIQVRQNIRPDDFRMWFINDENLFTDFIEKTILLVHVNPEIRSYSNDLLTTARLFMVEYRNPPPPPPPPPYPTLMPAPAPAPAHHRSPSKSRSSTSPSNSKKGGMNRFIKNARSRKQRRHLRHYHQHRTTRRRK